MTRSSIAASLVLALVLAATGCARPDDEAGGGSTSEAATESRFTPLEKGPTDRDLAALFATSAKFDTSLRGAFRFNVPTTERTDPEARQKRMRELMHRSMCTFFDESIDLRRAAGASRLGDTLADVNLDENAEGQEEDVKAFSAALETVLKNAKLDVLSGSAAGNNTSGEVMGVYDVANDELFFFGFSNCGSDD